MVAWKSVVAVGTLFGLHCLRICGPLSQIMAHFSSSVFSTSTNCCTLAAALKMWNDTTNYQQTINIFQQYQNLGFLMFSSFDHKFKTPWDLVVETHMWLQLLDILSAIIPGTSFACGLCRYEILKFLKDNSGRLRPYCISRADSTNQNKYLQQFAHTIGMGQSEVSHHFVSRGLKLSETNSQNALATQSPSESCPASPIVIRTGCWRRSPGYARGYTHVLCLLNPPCLGGTGKNGHVLSHVYHNRIYSIQLTYVNTTFKYTDF